MIFKLINFMSINFVNKQISYFFKLDKIHVDESYDEFRK